MHLTLLSLFASFRHVLSLHSFTSLRRFRSCWLVRKKQQTDSVQAPVLRTQASCSTNMNDTAEIALKVTASIGVHAV